ncbi:hypothetical protein JCGZ_04923 [Jatropha curcas]|uniref:Uncharacterized protein n=1 Tax=Jatropha curcas TaxID=180498 RepID=A0A067JM31_JATCU|nr:hypothetical protein JCGZ_04923 [Jatropha curcas]
MLGRLSSAAWTAGARWLGRRVRRVYRASGGSAIFCSGGFSGSSGPPKNIPGPVP